MRWVWALKCNPHGSPGCRTTIDLLWGSAYLLDKHNAKFSHQYWRGRAVGYVWADGIISPVNAWLVVFNSSNIKKNVYSALDSRRQEERIPASRGTVLDYFRVVPGRRFYLSMSELALCIRRTQTLTRTCVMLQVFLVMLQVFRVMLHVLRVSCNVTGNTCNITRNTCNITRVRVRRPRLPNTQSHRNVVWRALR